MDVLLQNILRLMEENGITDRKLVTDLKISTSSVSEWKSGKSKTYNKHLPKLAEYFNVSTDYLLGKSDKKQKNPPAFDIDEWIKKNAIPVGKMKPIPVLGVIRAGMPLLAEENIEYYDFADVSDAKEYFYLRVRGDSMIGAGITENSIVLIKKQNTAENGQIVACLVDGQNATLKRFKQHGKTIILMPENSKYDPIVLSCDDFENGYAKIFGVVKEMKIKFQ